MTGLQLAATAGALLALGAVLAVSLLAPRTVDLGDALARLAPTRHRPVTHHVELTATTGKERLGVWAIKYLPPALTASSRAKELAIMQMPASRLYGDKLMNALLGFVLPPLITWLFAVLGLQLPIAIPAAGGLALAVLMWWLPDYDLRREAKYARIEFTRALGAYIDLVALERNSGSGARQAMEVAAGIGDSWVFARLAEELARSRWSGLAPWEALRVLGDELGLPELGDLADIVRLSGEEGAQIYANLRARSAAMRTALLEAERAKAHDLGERLYIPASLLGVVFLAILLAPSLLRILTGS